MADSKSGFCSTVHQEDLTTNEKILRHFDISSQYGVSQSSPPLLPFLPPLSSIKKRKFKNQNQTKLNPSLSKTQPCIGIARMKRWKRADGLGLNPPVEVLAVLLKEQQQQAARKQTTQSKDTDRAYLDDLLSARIGID